MVDFVCYPDPGLALRAVARSVDPALLASGAQLLAAQLEARSYGLAAAHIGLNEPVIVLNLASAGAREDVLYYNPVVLDVADAVQMGREASVSLPGVEVQIARPIWAEIAFDDADGQRQIVRLDGFQARCALHEIDQMNGVFFLSLLSRLKRDAALRKFSKTGRSTLSRG
ncbi:peptide deformylase [Devosia sp.]|uniref:peptide deformylase n=1 Tax=Devosia sp. TaxID=1871048 RepID=UPI00326340F3